LALNCVKSKEVSEVRNLMKKVIGEGAICLAQLLGVVFTFDGLNIQNTKSRFTIIDKNVFGWEIHDTD
jgi:hypothetical protein